MQLNVGKSISGSTVSQLNNKKENNYMMNTNKNHLHKNSFNATTVVNVKDIDKKLLNLMK